MGLKSKARALEKRIGECLKQGRLEEAANIVFDNAEETVSLIGKFIPECAMREFRIKDRVDGYDIDLSSYDKTPAGEIAERRYGFERELLVAKNPRRVKRLWKEAKPRLEKRYGRRLLRREDLTIMNNLYRNAESFKNGNILLEDALRDMKEIEKRSDEFKGQGWEDVVGMWRDHHLMPRLCRTAGEMIGIIRSVADPRVLVKRGDPDWDDDWGSGDDLTAWRRGHSGDFPCKHYIDEEELEIVTDMLMKARRNELPFLDALNVLEPRYVDRTEIKNDMCPHGYRLEDSKIKCLREALYKTLKYHYDNRKDESRRDESFVAFIRWYSGLMLERWKSTAEDHEKLFRFHIPSGWDQWHIRLFYEMREGRHVSEYDKEYGETVIIGRLPQVLRLMVEDGIIKEEDIDPPLKERYLKPEEILTMGGKALTEGGIDAMLSLSMKRSAPKIVTGLDTRRMLPGPSDVRNLPAVINDLSGLADVLDLSKTYRVIFQGNHTVFIARERKNPDGTIWPGSIYRLAMLREGEQDEGTAVTIKGRRFSVREEADEMTEEGIRSSIWRVDKDNLPFRAVTYIVDIPPKEFEARYLKDFLAHALIHKSVLESMEKLQNTLDKIHDLVGHEISTYVGPTGNAILETFDIGGRFAFHVQASNEFEKTQAVFVSNTLRRYLNDVGLAYHEETDLDEGGRALSKAREDDRTFYRENIEAIVNSLKANLVKVLCFAFAGGKYDAREFGESNKPCETCGEKYFTGHIYPKGGDWMKGFYAANLHHLAKHPKTFVNEFGELRKIHALLCAAEEYTPLFLKHPEIISEFISELALFSGLFSEYVTARSRAFGFWCDYQGGISMYEKEEVEDSPELKAMSRKEKRLNAREKKAEKIAAAAAQELLNKYGHLIGDEIKKPYFNAMTYWADQIMLINIYQVCAPKMLTQSCGDVPEFEKLMAGG